MAYHQSRIAATTVPLKIHCKKTLRVPTLKFSQIVKNNESFAWEKFDIFQILQNYLGQGHQVTVAHNFFILNLNVSECFDQIKLFNTFNLVFKLCLQVQQKLRYSSLNIGRSAEIGPFRSSSLTHISDTGRPKNLKFWF